MEGTGTAWHLQAADAVEEIAAPPFGNGDTVSVFEDDSPFFVVFADKCQIDEVRFVDRKETVRFQQADEFADVIGTGDRGAAFYTDLCTFLLAFTPHDLIRCNELQPIDGGNTDLIAAVAGRRQVLQQFPVSDILLFF